MVPDSHQPNLGDRQNELNRKNANNPLSSSLSPSLYGTGNDRPMFKHDNTVSRQLLRDEVENTGGSECRLTTSLRTDSNGYETASGVMFTIQPSKDSIELQTLEFPTFAKYAGSSIPIEAGNVQVYYRSGTFSSVMKDPKAWTLLADTAARVIPPLPLPDGSDPADTDIWAIIPAHEFKPVTLKEDQIYSIYIYGKELSPTAKETLLKVKPANGLVGDISIENESLQVRTGVHLKGSSFPSKFEAPADFNGALHYRVTKSCNDSTMNKITEIVLEFAVNADPTTIVMGSLRNAVYETINELLSSNKNLARYSKEDMLKLEGIATDLKGRSEEKCPIDFANCVVIAATVTFKHLHDLDQGLLKLEFLELTKELDVSVFSYMSPVETSYVSNPLSKLEFVITLTGVPIGETMNDAQKRYFEDVTVDFLRNSRTSKVLNAIVNDEIPETPFIEDAEPPASRTRRRNLSSFFDLKTTIREADISMLRPMRKLQENAGSGGKIQIITEIAAETDEQQLRDTVLREIGKNPVEYSRELNSQFMRVNEEDFSNFFGSSTNVEVQPHVSTNGGSTPNTGNRISRPGETEGGSAGAVICILLIIFSILWLFYRIYMDCFYSPPQKTIKLNNGNDEFKDEEEDSNFNSSLFERMKLATGIGVTDSDETPNLHDSSESFGDKSAPTLTRKPSFPGLAALLNPSKPRSISGTAPARISSSNDDDFSCSSGDVESSDEESVARPSPPRLPTGPKRGRLAATKSMPIQQRNQTGPSPDVKKYFQAPIKSPPSDQLRSSNHRSSSPKRGRLAATKSMPVQKRNTAKQSNNTNRNMKGATPPSDQLRRSNHRPSSPTRGRLAAAKSMPVEKRNTAKQRTNTNRNLKAATKSPSTDPLRRSYHRSPSAPKRGRLGATKSMPVQKRNPAQRMTDTMKHDAKNQKKASSKQPPSPPKDAPPPRPPRRSLSSPIIAERRTDAKKHDGKKLDTKKHKKISTKSPPSPPKDSPPPRRSPGRSRSAPKKSKSLPLQKHSPAGQGASTKKNKKTAKKSPPSPPSDKLTKSSPRRSPRTPKKSTSLLLKKHDGKLTKKKQNLKRATSFESTSSSEKEGDVLVSSNTKKKVSAENNAKEPVKSKKTKKKTERRRSHSDKKETERRRSHSDKKETERRRSHSDKMKNQDAEKWSGMNDNGRESETSILKLADMVHDTSDSDSIASDSSSEVPSSINSPSTVTSNTLDETNQSASSSWTSASKKSYGKAGKIHFAGTKAKKNSQRN